MSIERLFPETTSGGVGTSVFSLALSGSKRRPEVYIASSPRLAEFAAAIAGRTQKAGWTLASGPAAPSAVNRTYLVSDALKDRISVAEQRDGTDVVLVERQTGCFGIGDDFAAAAIDLLAALSDLRDVLERDLTNEGVSPILLNQLTYLRQVLV